jgi:hypothetical protein
MAVDLSMRPEDEGVEDFHVRMSGGVAVEQ